MKAILVYRNSLLPPSETFIRGQAHAFSRFEAYYGGSRAIRGLVLPPNRTKVINQGSVAGYIRELYFRRTGRSGRLEELIRTSKPALIHAHFGPDACSILPAARRFRLPLVTTFHGYDVTSTDREWRRTRAGRRYLAGRPALQSEGALFLAVSTFVRSKLLDAGFDDRRLQVHYIGVDTEFFKPDPRVGRKPIVLFVGRLKQNKGCGYLVRAMQCVRAVAPEAELVVIGDGPLRQELQQQAKSSHVPCRFLGVQPAEEIRRNLQAATVFCVPSIEIETGESEGFGLVFSEALACGTPVVSFATGGIPEAVAHGETGYLAKPRDHVQLAYYIGKLLDDRHLWTRFSEAGRRRVEQFFDLRKQTAILEDLYDKVIEAYPTTRAPSDARSLKQPTLVNAM